MKSLCALIAAAAFFIFPAQASSVTSAIQRNDAVGVVDLGSFPVRLVASRSPSKEELRALVVLLEQYRVTSQPQSLQLIESYLSNHPDSPWALALRFNLGELYYESGFFSKAIDAFDHAWRVDGRKVDAATLPLRDAAIGQLAKMHARLGHVEELDAVLSEIGDRPVYGSASEAIAGAREGLYQMRNNHAVAYTCGPAALASVIQAARDGRGASTPMLAAVSDASLATIRGYPSGDNGIYMDEVAALAERNAMGFVAAHRPIGAELPLPAVVHWKVDHYAAIVAKQDGLYHVVDPTFGRDLWISEDALSSESSGIFLVPFEAAKGWALASAKELRETVGRGYVTSFDQGDTRSDSILDESQQCPRGMCIPNVVSMVNSLRLSDVPVGYQPAVGPGVFTRVTYNQREASQPATFSYTNLGPKWTMNWISYIEDNPASAGANARRIDGGGGSVSYEGYSAATHAFAREERDGAQLVQISASPIVYERRLGDGSKEVFAASNGAVSYPRRIFITGIVDPQGNALSLSYDTGQRLSTIKDAVGNVTTFSYQNSQNELLVTRITDPFGRVALFEYDANGRLQKITDTIGIESEFSYDAGSAVTSLQTPYGTTTFASGATGTQRWLNITDPMGGTRRAEFNAQTPGFPYSEPVPSGIPTFQYMYYRNSHYWDGEAWANYAGDYSKSSVKHWLHGKNTSMLAGVLDSSKEPLDSRIWYMNQGQSSAGFNGGTTLDRAVMTGRLLPGNVSQISTRSYTPSGNLLTDVDPLGRTLQYSYDVSGIDLLSVKQVVSGQSVTLSTFTYNAQHRPLTHVDSAGQLWTMTWNAQGQLLTSTNPKGEVTARSYNATGQLIEITGPGNSTLYAATYDAVGRVATEADAGGYIRTYSYDNLDRLITTTFPDGSTEVNAWTAMDLTSVKDRKNQVTLFNYNQNRMLTKRTTAGGLVTQYGYDRANRLVSMVDPRGLLTRWERDVQGRVTAKVFPDSTRSTYVYDTAGRLDRVVDATGQSRQYAYAKDDRVTGLGYPEAVQVTPAVSFVWDAYRPRVVSMTDGTGTTTYSYHAEGTLGGGKLAAEASSFGSTALQARFYDAVGRLDAISIGGSDEVYDYDALGRVTKVGNGLGDFTYAYLGSTDQMAEMAVNQIRTIFSYETNVSDRQLKSIGVSLGNSTYSTLNYGSDALGRLTSSSDLRKTVQGALVLRESYGYIYDANDRLTSVTGTSISYPQEEAFSYDASSNLLQQVRGAASWNATANGNNQLATVNSSPWSYDLAGNLLEDDLRTYLWDAEQRLVKVTHKGTGAISEFVYDGLGRRVKASERPTAAATPVVTYYGWCDGGVCQKRDSNQAVTATYFQQGEMQGTTPLYYNKDQLGSPREVLNQAGIAVGSMRYGAYGRTINANGVLPDRRYAGMFFHKESGLYLTMYRAYNPDAGRWISRDPIGEAGGDNLYAYVEGDPTNSIDPLGLTGYICKEGQNVGISLPIYFKDGSQESISRIVSAIERNWKGTFGQYNVAMKVVIMTSPNRAGNAITLLPGQGTSYVRGANTGSWYETASWPGNMDYPHEAGHLLGLPDRSGTSSGIMGRNLIHAKPTNRDIEQILADDFNVTGCGCK